MGNEIIIFGAGAEGKYIYRLLKYMDLQDYIAGFCDNNKLLDGKEIIDGRISHIPSHYAGTNKCYVIAVKDEKMYKEITLYLMANGENYYECAKKWAIANGISPIEWERDECAFYHVDDMEHYYREAESEAALATFWKKGTIFRTDFDKLDLRKVIELACGRGRHVPQYEMMAKNITLVDILEKNISICRERFRNIDKIQYYVNNGFNLQDLPPENYTALFSYDAMVHFEMFDIYEYLRDIFRVLKPKGKALIHHSNNHYDYMASFASAKRSHSRSFMSKELFAYLAWKCGFEILRQDTIAWGGIQDLDCVSLIQKP